MAPTLPNIPLPTLETVAVAVLFYLAGAVTPWYYAQERLRGFGRAMSQKLPYAPPAGMSEDEALEAATAGGRSTAEAAEEVEGENG